MKRKREKRSNEQKMKERGERRKGKGERREERGGESKSKLSCANKSFEISNYQNQSVAF